MFKREIINELKKWINKTSRKPLILRGARQVGKTTAIHQFSNEFDQYIYLNLEKKEHREIFEKDYPFTDLLTNLFLYFQKKRHGGKTLIFIDEIQNSPVAFSLLRYFYEEASDLYVVAASSLLESILGKNVSFPVGRVEYMILRPCSFREFLYATNNEPLAEVLTQQDIPTFLHDQLNQLFRKYATVGGMPEVLNLYAQNSDLTEIDSVYNSLITSYSGDVEKYASSTNQVQYLRHIISNAFREAGTKITFEKFGNSAYRSREMKEAFVSLEKTMLLKLVYPGTSIELPFKPNLERKPRLHVLDTGLINFANRILGELVFNENIADVHRGLIAEHIVGQELLAADFSVSNDLSFWVRERTDSSAEVDYIHPFEGKLIPVEVKSGSIGKLRSLHQFIDKVPHHLAVRVWQGPYSIEKGNTLSGKTFTLINLPFYLVHRLDIELRKVSDQI